MSVATVPSTTFSEVLLASDFSEESDRALTYAKSIVRGSGGELLLVHVAQLAPVLALPEGVWVDDRVRTRAEEQATEESAAALRAKGVRAKAFCSLGSVGQRIAQTAEIHRADLVIMGTHARRGLNRLIFGSYAEETAGFLETPLLIVGPRAPLATQGVWKPSRILCSISLSAGDARLVAFAYLLATKYEASFEVVWFTTGLKDWTDSPWVELRESVRKLLDDEHNPNELPLHIVPLPEPKAKSLIEAVITRNADLLVIGGENREWLTLHEGTLPELLADVPCPILTFPGEGCREKCWEKQNAYENVAPLTAPLEIPS
jgi:nucleotide-binding universal stress UspA family protein